MDRPGRDGLALLLALTPLQFLLLPFAGLGFYAVWGLAAAGVLLCRHDPSLRRGVLPALALLAVLVALTLVGAGVTVGGWEGPLLAVGGDITPMLAAIFFVPIAPGAVLLGVGRPGAARTMARLSVAGAVAAFALAAWAYTRSVPTGDFAQAMSLANLAMLLAYPLGLGALALGLRARWAPGAAAHPGASPEAP